MNLKEYEKYRRFCQGTDDDVILSIVEENPEHYMDLLEEDDKSKIYLRWFADKMEDKAFVRNLEREDSDTLPKVVSSCLTHLFIEDEKNTVPPYVFDTVQTQLNNILDDKISSVETYWEEII